MNDKKLGAIYGALIGDATGCPYEFNSPEKLPHPDEIDMFPPSWWECAYPNVKLGTYTDDGAQTLCLLESLIEGGDLITVLRTKLQKWLHEGYMAVDSYVFDVGSQTRAALLTKDHTKVFAEEASNGNGALMRCIPVAVMAQSEDYAITIAMEQAKATHPHMWSQLTCAAYALIGYWMIRGHKITISDCVGAPVEQVVSDAESLIIPAFSLLQRKFPEHRQHLAYIYNYRYTEPTGTGFVVDAFWSALFALRVGDTYEKVIKRAIELGHDTDTTACIAGGLAGIKFGMAGIPRRWIDGLRGRELIDSLAARASLGVEVNE